MAEDEIKRMFKRTDHNELIDTIIEVHLMYLSRYSGLENTIKILKSLGTLKKFINIKVLTTDSIAKWNAHYEIVKKEYHAQTLKVLEKAEKDMDREFKLCITTNEEDER